MSSEFALEKEGFQKHLQSLFEQSNFHHDEVFELRKKAWTRFLQLGLPDKNSEIYRYIKLRQFFCQQPTFFSSKNSLTKKEIEKFIQPECKDSFIVFVNGNYCSELSNTKAVPSSVAILSLQEAMATYGTFLTNQWSKSIKEEKDAFALLNSALHQQGAFIYVPPKTVCSATIQILNFLQEEQSNSLLLTNPRLQLFIGAQSEANFLICQKQSDPHAQLINQLIEVSLEESARAHFSQLYYEQPALSWKFSAFRATLKRNAYLKTLCISEGSATTRMDYHVTLTGENSEASLNGLCMVKEKREAHTNICIEHQAPHCRSHQLFKSILNDFGKTSFEGKILVKQAAQKTEAFQLNNNLLLSDYAHADSKPNLEIFADDVKASHGATVGQLDQEQLFYMKTRGFSHAIATNLLVFGFCEQIITMIAIPSIKKAVAFRAHHYLME